MKKGLLLGLIIGLLCWAGQSFATTITLDNGIVSYTITNGVVVDAKAKGGTDALDKYTFIMYSNETGAVDISGAAYKGKTGKGIAGYGQADKFSKSVIGIGGKAVTYSAEFALLPGKRYLDTRYTLYASGAAPILTDVRGYVLLEPVSGHLGASDESPISDWQMINDKQSPWTANKWTYPTKVLSGEMIGFAARVPKDDFVGGNRAAVEALVAAGVALPNTITQATPGALAMRIPVSPATVNVPPQFTVETRLEVVPEPCTMSLMLAGLAGLGVMRRRSRKS